LLRKRGISAPQQDQNQPIAKAGNARCNTHRHISKLLFETQEIDMPTCEVCGNDYDKAFQVVREGHAGNHQMKDRVETRAT
jgi:hypothetical protein